MISLKFTTARSLPVLFFSLYVHAFSQSPNAGAYLSVINEQHNKVSQDMMAYISAVNHGKSARKIEKRRTELAAQIKESERNTRTLKPFGDTRLRDSTANYFRIGYHIINDDYGKVVDLEDIAEQSYDAMEAYLLAKEVAEEKMQKAFDASAVEFRTFASANNIQIVESSSKLGQRLSGAGEVNKYYNQVYLLFFKSYKNEAYLMDALTKQNIIRIEQSRNALLASAAEDLTKLGPMQAFKGDGSLKNGAQQLLKFYKSEASDRIPVLVDFLLAQEKFESAKKAFDSKSQSARTQTDIDSFNKAVNDFNAKAKLSNQVNDELNKKRSTFLKSWNETSSAFLDKHTPR